MQAWVAVDIGCIECGEPTDVLGIFQTPEEAQSVLDAARVEQRKDWHGQHSFQSFEVELPTWACVAA